MDISPPNTNNSAHNNELEILAILLELRNARTNETESPLLEWHSRFDKVSATPHQIMQVIVPRLLFAPLHHSPGDSSPTISAETISSDDALNILGYLVAPSPATKDQSAKYLEVASQVIRSELEKTLRNRDERARELIVSTKFLAVLVHQACTGWNVAVAQNSHTSLLLLQQLLLQPSSPLDTLSFLWNEIVATFSTALSSIHVDRTGRTDPAASTMVIRCATLTVDLVVQNDRAMQMARDAAALDVLLQLFQVTAGDPLLQLSVLELFQTLASTRPRHALRARWLLSDAVTQPFLRVAGIASADGEEEVEADAYLQGPALRILASLCSCISTATQGTEGNLPGIRDGLVHDLLRALRSFDVTGGELDRLSFIDAVSSLASTSPVALHRILDDAMLRETWLNLSVAQPKLKSAILVSLAHVIDPEEGGPIVPDSLTNEDRMKLYAALGMVNRGPNHADSTELLLHLVGSPIPEIRYGVYRLWQAVAKNSLGGQVLLTHPSQQFFDFLMSSSDRMIESTYEGRILKYAIVEAIYQNATLQQLVSNDIVQQLQQCLARGPHYKTVLSWDVVTAEQ
jgi:Proteasome non-ATPase 26S subunit